MISYPFSSWSPTPLCESSYRSSEKAYRFLLFDLINLMQGCPIEALSLAHSQIFQLMAPSQCRPRVCKPHLTFSKWRKEDRRLNTQNQPHFAAFHLVLLLILIDDALFSICTPTLTSPRLIDGEEEKGKSALWQVSIKLPITSPNFFVFDLLWNFWPQQCLSCLSEKFYFKVSAFLFCLLCELYFAKPNAILSHVLFFVVEIVLFCEIADLKWSFRLIKIHDIFTIEIFL